MAGEIMTGCGRLAVLAAMEPKYWHLQEKIVWEPTPIMWASLECFPGFSRARGGAIGIIAHVNHDPALIRAHAQNFPKDSLWRDEIGVWDAGDKPYAVVLSSTPCKHFSLDAKVVRKAAEQDTGFDKFFRPKYKGRYEAGKSSKLNGRERSKKKRQSKKKRK